MRRKEQKEDKILLFVLASIHGPGLRVQPGKQVRELTWVSLRQSHLN